MGIELRDIFAAAALPGLIESRMVANATETRPLSERTAESFWPMAEAAYKIADAMLRARVGSG